MGVPRRKRLILADQVLRSLAAGGLAAASACLVVSLVGGYLLVSVAVMGAGVAVLAFCVHRVLQRSADDARAVVRTLNDIGNGTFSRLSEIPCLPGGSAIGAAVNAMSAKISRRLEDLHEVSQRDALTGLLNRACFQRSVEPFLVAGNPESPHCILFIDLDGFKQVNDTLGHGSGDRLLRTAADRLRIATHLDEILDPLLDRSCDAPTIHLARFGGDEFVIFLANAASGTVARKIASRISRVLSEPFELGAHSACVSASVGVAFFPQCGTSYSELLRAADTAMYHAKRSGRNRCEFYTPALDDAARAAAAEEQTLREALTRGEFELHYQPLYDVRTMQITSAEALIRWHHPVRGLLLPGEFMPLAERANMICQIGEWVIGEATRTIAQLERAGKPLQISINISPLHLEQIEFVSLVRSSLKRWQAPAHLLDLEITEEVAMRDPELAAERLRQLSELGVAIAIDDFGTGYSNLASLTMLPVSRLKIDRSLLHDLALRPEARVLVQTIISMANGLGFHSVAEGVETRAQLDLLSAMGCDVVQGYLMSRAVELSRLKQLLDEGSPQAMVNGEFNRVA